MAAAEILEQRILAIVTEGPDFSRWLSAAGKDTLDDEATSAGIISLLDPERVSLVRQALADKNPQLAVQLIAAEILIHRSPVIAKDPDKTINDKKRTIVERRSSARIVGTAPRAFPLGKAAHNLIEGLHCHATELEKYLGQNVMLEGNDQVITDIRFGKAQAGLRQTSFLDIANFSKGIETDLDPGRVHLEIPLQCPQQNQSVAEWGVELIAESLNDLRFSDDPAARPWEMTLPETPSQIQELIQDPQRRDILVRLLEVCHILCGQESGLSLVFGSGQDRFIGSENIPALKVLNWLCVARNIVDVFRYGPLERNDSHTFAEMPIGRVYIADFDKDLVINGGTCDMVRMRMPIAVYQGLGFRPVANSIQYRFGNQDRRHYRKENNGGELVVKETRLRGSFENIIMELWKIYGSRVFSMLEIEVEDLKVPWGDGGWAKVIDTGDLPVRSHLAQVSEYLYLLAAQLCRIKKRVSSGRVSVRDGLGNYDTITVTPEEILNFINTSQIFTRLKGTVLYQTPGRVLPYSLEVPEDIPAWADSILARKRAATERAVDECIYAALALLTLSREKGIEVKERKVTETPEGLRWLCKEMEGQKFLVLRDLEKWMLSREWKKLGIKEAVYYQDEDAYVLWLDGLAGDEEVCRLAIQAKTGKFVLTGGKELVRGSLATTSHMVGVAERSAKVMAAYRNWILGKLSKCGLSILSPESAKDRDYLIGPDGAIVTPADGKPILCYCDPMTGEWRLHHGWIQEWSEARNGLPDKYNIAELLRLLTVKASGEVICLHPTHAIDKGTPSAYYYAPEGKIKCFSGECGESIRIPRGPWDRIRIPTEPPQTAEDYKVVTHDRAKAFQSWHNLAKLCAEHNNLASNYLASRGIDLVEDLNGGYVPHELADSISLLLNDRGFWKEIKDRKLASKRIPLDVVVGYLGAELSSSAQAVLQSLNFLPPQAYREACVLLNVDNLKSWKTRNIAKRHRIKDSQEREVRIGNRVQALSYWFQKDRDGWSGMAPCNIQARAIKQEGQSVARGPDHYKVIRPSKGKWVGNTFKYNTPAGFWTRDAIGFWSQVKLFGEAVVFEGMLNAASFNRFAPAARDMSIAIGGTENYLMFVAMVKSAKIHTVYLAMDFDMAGQKAQARLIKMLQDEIPDIEIKDVKDMLPSHVAEIIPTDPFVAQESGIGDMNDVLCKTKEGQRYAFQPAQHDT